MLFFVSALTSIGFVVAATNDFGDAKATLSTRPLQLLLAEIRLGAYNGLQLAFRARFNDPQMAILVTSHYADPFLQVEAERMGATFVPKPVSASEFLAAVSRTRRRARQAGPAEAIRPPFERRKSERRQPVPAVHGIERRHAERRNTLILAV